MLVVVVWWTTDLVVIDTVHGSRFSGMSTLCQALVMAGNQGRPGVLPGIEGPACLACLLSVGPSWALYHLLPHSVLPRPPPVLHKLSTNPPERKARCAKEGFGWESGPWGPGWILPVMSCGNLGKGLDFSEPSFENDQTSGSSSFKPVTDLFS